MTEAFLRFWKAYGIGPGKCIQLTKLGIPPMVPIPDLVKCDGDIAKPTPKAHFIKIKSRLLPRSDDSQKCSDTEEEPRTDTRPVPLFSCPEEGCVKEYQRYYHKIVSQKSREITCPVNSALERQPVRKRMQPRYPSQ